MGNVFVGQVCEKNQDVGCVVPYNNVNKRRETDEIS